MDSPRILGVRTVGDELLAAIAPLGLALAAGTALVVDLNGDHASYPRDRTLAELVGDGPRRSELAPDGRGVAVIANGGVAADEALGMVETLAAGWPAVVVRVATAGVPFPVLPVRPLWPGFLAPEEISPAVWQRAPGGGEAPGPGPVLPVPGRSTVTTLLAGRRPVHSRWIRAWRGVWELPWH